MSYLANHASAVTLNPTPSAPSGRARKGLHPTVTAFTGTDRFEVRCCLGSGAFGVVYEAFDRASRTRVALKLPHAGSAQGLYLFKQEFRSLADVTHRNLATLFELHTDRDRWFFTMELVDGPHILDYLRKAPQALGESSTDTHSTGPRTAGLGTPGPTDRTGQGIADLVMDEKLEAPVLPSPPRDYAHVRAVFRQLAEGLAALHAAGMLHRDLKPSNVLVTRAGRVVILDFGLVTDLEASRGGDPFEGLAGTPAYIAPEQVAGQPATSASDWYSVGVLLYQILTGRLPCASRIPWSPASWCRARHRIWRNSAWGCCAGIRRAGWAGWTSSSGSRFPPAHGTSPSRPGPAGSPWWGGTGNWTSSWRVSGSPGGAARWPRCCTESPERGRATWPGASCGRC